MAQLCHLYALYIMHYVICLYETLQPGADLNAISAYGNLCASFGFNLLHNSASRSPAHAWLSACISGADAPAVMQVMTNQMWVTCVDNDQHYRNVIDIHIYIYIYIII